MVERELYVRIWRELSADKAMIFVAGPRQAGKTTLAEIISRTFTNSLYFNWDIPAQRLRLIENPTFFEEVERKDASLPLIVFDEIHKYKDWKNYLKGVYDQYRDRYRFLVSGSGRLDLYRKGGDSLAGRYFLFHLWPFTIAELSKKKASIEEWLRDPLRMEIRDTAWLRQTWENLSLLSGFPEPYLSGKISTYRRWSNAYSRQLIREDIREMTDVHSIGAIETLYHLLPSKVGSPLSIPSLAAVLKTSYNSISNWLAIFERFFLIFSLPAWTERISRAIQMERKVYLWDSPAVKDPAAHFENRVAQELWRAVHSWTELGLGAFSLHFIRDKEKREVDFLIAGDGAPLLIVEAKLADADPSPSLKRFQKLLGIPAVQLVHAGEGYRLVPNGERTILVAPAYLWLSRLP